MGLACPACCSPCGLSDLSSGHLSQVQKGTRGAVRGLWFCLTELTQSCLSSGVHLCHVPSGDTQQRYECGLAFPESPCELLGLYDRGTVGWPGALYVCMWKLGPPSPRISPGLVCPLHPEATVSRGTLLSFILCEPQASASNPLTGTQLDPRKSFPTEKPELGRE